MAPSAGLLGWKQRHSPIEGRGVRPFEPVSRSFLGAPGAKGGGLLEERTRTLFWQNEPKPDQQCGQACWSVGIVVSLERRGSRRKFALGEFDSGTSGHVSVTL